MVGRPALIRQAVVLRDLGLLGQLERGDREQRLRRVENVVQRALEAFRPVRELQANTQRCQSAIHPGFQKQELSTPLPPKVFATFELPVDSYNSSHETRSPQEYWPWRQCNSPALPQIVRN